MLKSHKTSLKIKENARIAEIFHVLLPGRFCTYTCDLSYSICQKLFLVLVEGFSTDSGLANCFGIIQRTTKTFVMFLDNLFGCERLFCCEFGTRFLSYLFTSESCCLNTFGCSLVKIRNFFLSLLECKSNLLFGKCQEILVDSFQDKVNVGPGRRDSTLKCFFVGISVDMRLFEEDKIDSACEQLLVHKKAFFCITGHSRDRIKNNSISGFNLAEKFVQFFSALEFWSGEDLPDDIRFGMCRQDVTNLSLDILFWCADSCITVFCTHVFSPLFFCYGTSDVRYFCYSVRWQASNESNELLPLLSSRLVLLPFEMSVADCLFAAIPFLLKFE